MILVVAGFAYIVYYFVQNGFTLGLNIVNMIFLFLGILLHGDLRRYVDAIGEAAAGANLGIDAGRTAMAIAWGDQWTNMIQPFWALPALGIAKLSARDIMGYLVIVLLFTGVVACLGFLAWGLWF